MDAAKHDVRGCAQAADLVGLGLAVHAEDPRPEGLVATGLVDLVGDARDVERLRCAAIHLGPVRDETQDDPLRLGRVGSSEDVDSVRFEGRRGATHPLLVCHSRETAAE